MPVKIFRTQPNIAFVKHRYIAFLFSGFLSVFCLVLLLWKGLHYGVDFAGGAVLEVETTTDIEAVRQILHKQVGSGAVIQQLDTGYLVRFQASEGMQTVNSVKDAILNYDHKTIFHKVDFVGPKVGKELIEKAILAVLMAVIGILAYIAMRFNWQFGLAAVVSLAHDAIATLGFFIVTGLEFDINAIAAILTILGYSINDTVVIYDRIRENLKRYSSYSLEEIINRSINETLTRTIMTVTTVLLVCLCLVLFSGEALFGFSMAMLFGVAFGTYSSLYIAAPLLLHTK